MTHKIFLILLILLIIGIANVLSQSPFGKALDLDGNKNYVKVPDDNSLHFGKHSFTVEFWMKSRRSDPFAIINQWIKVQEEGFNHQGWLLELNRMIATDDPLVAIPYPGAYRLVAAYIDSENENHGGGWSSSGRTNIVRNVYWQHIALSVDVENQIRRTYFDYRANKGGEDWPETFEEDHSNLGYPLNIGGFPIDIDSTLYYNGLIDEIRVWNVARSERQIWATIEDTLGPEYYLTPDSGLVAYFRFDKFENLGIGEDDLADDIRDWSTYGNHADLIGYAELTDISLVVEEQSKTNFPEKFMLLQNYPNPFNASTTIRYQLPKSTFVTLKVYNTLGHRVDTIIKGFQPAGFNEIIWNANDLPSGIYIYRIETKEFTKTFKMLLQK